MSHPDDRLSENTLLRIEEHFAALAPTESRWARYAHRGGSRGFGAKLSFRAGEPVIPVGTEVDFLYVLTAGTVRMMPVRGSQADEIPAVTVFHAQQDGTVIDMPNGPSGAPTQKRLSRDQPVLGARYFFTRRPAAFAYLATTDATVLAIDSKLILDIATTSEGGAGSDGLLLMRAVLINSDVAVTYAPRLLRALGGPRRTIKDAYDLVVIVEEIQALGLGVGAGGVISEMFEKCLQLRIQSAAEQGIDSTIVIRD